MRKIVLAALIAMALMAGAATETPDQLSARLVAEAAALLDRYRGDGASLEQADVRLRAALEANPKEATAHVEYARLIMKSAGLSEPALAAAEQSIRRALAIDPNHGNAYVLLGYVLTNATRFPEAETAFTRAKSLRATSPWLAPNEAELMEKQGRANEAALLYTRIAAEPAVDRSVRLGALEKLAKHHVFVTRDFDLAERAYRDQLALDPQSPWVRSNFSQFLRIRRLDAGGAERYAREALGMMSYGAARDALGLALYLQWAEALATGADAARAAELFAEAGRYVADPSAIVAEVGYYPRPHPILEALVSKGIALDIMPGLPGGTTPLSLAATGGNPALASRMIELGAYPNTPGYMGSTPLMIAALRGDEAMVRVLLERGADPTLVDTDGKDAERSARDGGHARIAAALAAAKQTYVRVSPGPTPNLPFRTGTLYGVKRDIGPRGIVQFRAGERLVFDNAAPERDPAMLKFNFRDADKRIREFRIERSRLSTWSDWFEEIGPQPAAALR